ncbi:MAG: hypothetical protein SGBAC_007871 [Bacillariaceae sp.]
MSHLPWRSNRYAEVGENDDRLDTEESRRYPYFPTQQASDCHSAKNNNSWPTLNFFSSTLDMEFCSPDSTSPLGVGETTSDFFTADFPLVPSGREKPRAPRPTLRRTNSSNRRRFNKDLKLQKSTILQSIKGNDSDGDDEKLRGKSKAPGLGGAVNDGGTRNEEDDSKSIESRLGKLKVKDDIHRRRRVMARIPKGNSLSRGRAQRQRSERSLQVSSRSPSDEKRDLKCTIRSQRRTQRRSESDLHELQSRSTVVEGTGGCSIIRPNRRFKPMDLSRLSDGKISPPSSEPRLLRGQSHKRLQAKLVNREQGELNKNLIEQPPNKPYKDFYF